MLDPLLDNIDKIGDLSKLPGAVTDADGVVTVPSEEVRKAQERLGLIKPIDPMESLREATDQFLSSPLPKKQKRDVRSLLEEKVVQRVGRKGKYMTDKLFELIDGIYVVDKVKRKDNGGEIRYYKIPPNLQAIQYAMDRVLGKPKQVSFTANFSLAKLLTGDESGSANNTEVQTKSSLLHRDGMEAYSTEG